MIRAALTFGCLAVALLCGPGAARADSLQEIFERSNAAYFRADYDQASEGYLELVELGVLDPDVSYNLATSEARRGRFGSAIRYFERTLWLRPGDDDAREGLAAARSAVGRRRADRQGMAQIDSAPPLAEALFGGVSREVFAVTTLAAEVVLCGALLGLLALATRRRR